MTMRIFTLDPRDTLFFGDGRSITVGPAHGHLVPAPSVLAGAIRTWQGLDESGRWRGDPADAKRIRVQGPFPVILGEQGEIADWLFPAPADALEMEDDQPPREREGAPADRTINRLVPLALNIADRVDLASGSVVGMPTPDPRKPYRDTRPWWRWSSELRAWLAAPSMSLHVDGERGWGVPAPLLEPRTHVSIHPDTGTAIQNALFTVNARRWVVRLPRERLVHLGIAVRTEANVLPSQGALGGEHRVVGVRPFDGEFPACPAEVLESVKAGAVRLLLATPAIFEDGSRPGPGLALPAGSEVVAFAHQRAQVVSGWDYAKRCPKPTRRMVPAGAVMFIRLGGSTADREAWAEKTWGEPISDEAQDRVDGFGTALLGAWDGRAHPLS
jgi:CRISPR-associated protein Cmr3